MLHVADVVIGQIGKNTGIKADSFHAVHPKALRRNLHNNDLDAGLNHLIQVCVNDQAFGRGVGCLLVNVTVHNAVGTYVPSGNSRGVQNTAEI